MFVLIRDVHVYSVRSIAADIPGKLYVKSPPSVTSCQVEPEKAPFISNGDRLLND